LEVGLGSGKFAVPLDIKIGVESSDNIALKTERRGIRVFQQVTAKLPFPDSKSDLVLMVTTIGCGRHCSAMLRNAAEPDR
jgi:hypothetical protein